MENELINREILINPVHIWYHAAARSCTSSVLVTFAQKLFLSIHDNDDVFNSFDSLKGTVDVGDWVVAGIVFKESDK